jgi:hypothetical protein
MTTTDSRVRSGSMKFTSTVPVPGTEVDFSAQATAMSIVPNVDEQDPIEVLDGTKVGGTSTNNDTLDFTVISDHASASGLIAYSWANRGKPVDFDIAFDAAPANVWTGQVVMQALVVGGPVGEQLQIDGSLKITALTPPTGYVPAGGTFGARSGSAPSGKAA